MPEEPGQASGWTSFIPEFFFDVISRIPPGMFLAAFLVLRWSPFLRNADLPLPAFEPGDFPYTVVFLVLIAFGHSLGIFITPLGDIVRRSYLKRTWLSLRSGREALYLDVYRRWGNGADSGDSPVWQMLPTPVYARIYRYMHDWTKAAHPKADLLLAKMSAESAVCENSVGALLLAILVELSVQPWQHWPATVLPFSIATTYLYYAAQWRFKRFLAGQFSYYALVRERQNLVPR